MIHVNNLNFDVRNNCYLGIAYIKDKIELDKFTNEMWTLDHSRLIRSFLTDPNFGKLFMWVDSNGLRYHKIEPPTLSPGIVFP